MRILHTADWHLGGTLNGWTRDAEHRQWLGDLADVIEDEAVDVMLVAGDVYDGINPSGEAQRLLYDALAHCRRRNPDLTIIIASGNHDPAGRLEAPEAILRGMGCHVIGTMSRIDGELDHEKHLIPLRDRSGVIRGHVLAIPFLRASDLPGMLFLRDEDHLSPVAQAAHRFHHELVAEILPLAGGMPLIAMGHLHCMAGEESVDSERRILLGGEHAVPASIFPEEIAYVALGHLHKPQSLDGGRIRYSGSIFPKSATEADYRHGVTIIDIIDGEISHRHHPMPRPAEFIRIPERGQAEIGDLEQLMDEAVRLGADLPVELRPFVHVTLAATGPAAVIRAEAERIIANLPVRLAALRILRDHVDEEIGIPAKSLAEISVDELFARAFLKVNGTEPEARHVAAFSEIAGTI
ncbi:exonuclease SbcCD subunit D [Paracoccus litorisediminis]|uniref:exonuclease SbcCD subunit D n=1 Tax=Paracoccus litorisediminis TaxID=2006130 RepID=UPI003732440E